MGNWLALGNCFSQDLANALNRGLDKANVECRWLSSPKTCIGAVDRVPSILLEKKELLAPNMESRPLENQILRFSSSPDRIIVNLFHVEGNHYRHRKTGFLFYLPHPELADQQLRDWLSEECVSESSGVSLSDYKKLLMKLRGTYSVPIDFFVRSRVKKNGFCYLKEWEQDGESWVKEIKGWDIEETRMVFLDELLTHISFPYFLIDTSRIFFTNKYTVRTDFEHLSIASFNKIAELCYGGVVASQSVSVEDIEADWSLYLRSIVEGPSAIMPKSEFPISKYLLRSLKEVCRIGLFKSKDVLLSHMERVEREYPSTPYYHRYLEQCRAALSLIDER